MTDLLPVLDALSGKRYRYRNEAVLHDGLAEALDAAGIAYEREVHVVGGRIDFLIGDLGVEVKIGGGAGALHRQVEGYSHEERIARLLVVTTRPAHRAVVGQTANGKHVHVLTTGGLSL